VSFHRLLWGRPEPALADGDSSRPRPAVAADPERVCDFCRHAAVDLAAALTHARMHARSWRDEALTVEGLRRQDAARVARVAGEVREALLELEGRT
jgi:hypothetical protein